VKVGIRLVEMAGCRGPEGGLAKRRATVCVIIDSFLYEEEKLVSASQC
jgi:hypothetical protein